MENFTLISSQRYFHLVAFRGATSAFTNSYLLNLNIKPKKDSKDVVLNEMIFRQMEFYSDKPYNNGNEDFSLNKDGKAPFVYDFIMMSMEDENISFFCFPFKKMCKMVISDWLKNHSLLKYGKFLKIDLNDLVKEDSPTDYFFDNISYYFNSIELALPGEVNLSTVKLEGDKPLDSLIYKEVFKERISDDTGRIEKASLKCNSVVAKDENIPSVRSSFHIDKYGNYKLYVQSSGLNLITVPLVFYSFVQVNCLSETSNNPTLALTNNELE